MSCQAMAARSSQRAADGDLELARQEGELRLQRAPLAQRFRSTGAGRRSRRRRRRRSTSAGDVADAVAARSGCRACRHRRARPSRRPASVERDPVELAVLARREVAEAAVVARVADARPSWRSWRLAQLAVGNGDAQPSARGAARTSRSAGAAAGSRRRASSPARWRSSWSRNCAARGAHEAGGRIRCTGTSLSSRCSERRMQDATALHGSDNVLRLLHTLELHICHYGIMPVRNMEMTLSDDPDEPSPRRVGCAAPCCGRLGRCSAACGASRRRAAARAAPRSSRAGARRRSSPRSRRRRRRRCARRASAWRSAAAPRAASPTSA